MRAVLNPKLVAIFVKKDLNRGFDENEVISQAHCANTFIKL